MGFSYLYVCLFNLNVFITGQILHVNLATKNMTCKENYCLKENVLFWCGSRISSYFQALAFILISVDMKGQPISNIHRLWIHTKVHLSSTYMYLENEGWSYWPIGARMLNREISFWKYRSFFKSIQWPVKLSTTLKQHCGIISGLIKSEKSMSGGLIKKRSRSREGVLQQSPNFFIQYRWLRGWDLVITHLRLFKARDHNFLDSVCTCHFTLNYYLQIFHDTNVFSVIVICRILTKLVQDFSIHRTTRHKGCNRQLSEGSSVM